MTYLPATLLCQAARATKARTLPALATATCRSTVQSICAKESAADDSKVQLTLMYQLLLSGQQLPARSGVGSGGPKGVCRQTARTRAVVN